MNLETSGEKYFYNNINQTDNLEALKSENIYNKSNIKKKFNTDYVPFKTPRVTKYDKWCERYNMYLMDMYEIMIVKLRSDFSNEINYDFDVFCKFIFKNSSKYIM